MDVDGLFLARDVAGGVPGASLQERGDRLRWLLTENPDLPGGHWFDRTPLVSALQLALTDLRQPVPGRALADLSDQDLADGLIDALERVNVVRAQDGQQPPNNPAVA